jgi:hypothetical protein
MEPGGQRNDGIDLEASEAVETFLFAGSPTDRPDATVTVTVSDQDEALEASVDGGGLGLLVGQRA